MHTPEDEKSPEIGNGDVLPAVPEPESGMDMHLRADLVDDVRTAIAQADRERARALVAELHVADVADLFEILSGEERRALAPMVVDALDPDFLSELDGATFEDVVGAISPKDLADAVQQLDTDDAVYVLEDLDEGAQREVLDALSREDRLAVEEGLSYPEDSAGRLMQRDLVAMPEFWTIGQAIDHLRSRGEAALPDDFYEVIVVDPTWRPIGSVPLSRILRGHRSTKIRDVMVADPHVVRVHDDQEEVARQFAKYHLISSAVINEHGRLVGVITVDDIVDVIEEEAGEDILALAGVREGDVNESISLVARGRLIWLLVNLVTAIFAASVISLFTDSIEKIVALAVLMPIVASMGGNAGNQTMAVAVRALATRDLGRANAARVIRKELYVAVINGLALGLLLGLVAWAWFGVPVLAAVLGLAMVINMLVAGLGGILVPLTLERFNIDPAVASSVFVTTLTDVIGFLAFLGLATIVLL